MKKILAVLVLATALVWGTGCGPRMMGAMIGATIVTAAILGTAHALHHHDGHFHHESCGHYRRYHHGHWVYQYDGRWEYYDQYNGGWYYYAE